MERAQTTKKNDAVTLRQFNLFLKTANLPSQFKGTVKQFKDVVQQMPIILQDLLFAEWISKHLKKDPHFPQGKPYPNDQYLMKQMSLQRLYRDIQYDTWRAQQLLAVDNGDSANHKGHADKVLFTKKLELIGLSLHGGSFHNT